MWWCFEFVGNLNAFAHLNSDAKIDHFVQWHRFHRRIRTKRGLFIVQTQTACVLRQYFIAFQHLWHQIFPKFIQMALRFSNQKLSISDFFLFVIESNFTIYKQ